MTPAAVTQAFRDGGYVTVYEADAYLRLERGTCRAAALAGLLPYVARQFGRKTRYIVQARDAERLYGITVKARAC
jgi:hypothetical protein